MASETIGAGKIIDLSVLSHEAAIANGWWEKERNLGEMIALIHSELGEFRSVMFAKEPVLDDHLPGRYNADVELADTFIRLGDMLGGYGLYWSEDEPTSCAHVTFSSTLAPQAIEDQLVENMLLTFTDREAGTPVLRTSLQALQELPPRELLTDPGVVHKFVVLHLSRPCQFASQDAYLLYLHSLLSLTLERQRKKRDEDVLSLDLFVLMTSIDVLQAKRLKADDFAALVRQKIEFNASRGKKHGKNF